MARKARKRTGRIYGTFEGRDLYDNECSFAGIERCCHFPCRLDALRKAGLADVADRLDANAKSQDWLRNWGRMVYDPSEHGRDARRRKVASQIVRAMRSGKADYSGAVRAGAWLGAAL
jgi:hypothetical protein